MFVMILGFLCLCCSSCFSFWGCCVYKSNIFFVVVVANLVIFFWVQCVSGCASFPLCHCHCLPELPWFPAPHSCLSPARQPQLHSLSNHHSQHTWRSMLFAVWVPGCCCFSSVFLLNVFAVPSAFCFNESFSFYFFSFPLCLHLGSSSHLPFDIRQHWPHNWTRKLQLSSLLLLKAYFSILNLKEHFLCNYLWFWLQFKAAESFWVSSVWF